MGRTFKVLLVDDEPIVGKRLGPALTKQGYTVEVLETGEAALQRLRETKFDIVISDIRMDDVDGLEVLQAVQKEAPDTKTILITGYATAEVVREALARGAFEILAKPFRPNDLVAAVEKAAREISGTSGKE